MSALPAKGVVLKRTLAIRQYENTLVTKIAARQAQARDAIAGLLQQRPIDAVSAGRQAARADSIASAADDILKDAYRDVWSLSRDDLVGLAGSSARQAGVITQAMASEGGFSGTVGFDLPSAAQLRAIVVVNPMNGAPLKDWWGQQSQTDAFNVRRQIQLGMVNGESTGQIIDRVRGSSLGGGKYDGGVFATSTRNAAAIVRTAVNYVNNQAAVASYAENDDVVSEVEWVATEDNRTCPQCGDLDGETWALDDPKLQTPPAHVNCRCTVVPVMNWKALGVSAPPDTTSGGYLDWFDGQSQATQDDVLGPSRGDLYRSGDTSFSDFLRQDGSLVPLDKLG